MGGRAAFCIATLAAMASAISACGTPLEEALKRPGPIVFRDESVFTLENSRLTERGELLGRVEPFVRTPRTAILTISVALPAPMRVPVTESTPAEYAITVGAGGGSAVLDDAMLNRLLLDYRDDRILQIDRLCAAYFGDLERIAGRVDYTSSLVNIGGDYLTVLLGLAEAPAKQLAILAGSQAAFNQTVDATRTLLILSPPPSAVYALVSASQREIVGDAAVTTTPTFRNVEQQVHAYASACTPIGIRAIVNEAITREARERDPAQTGPAGQALLAEITGMLNAGQVEADKVALIDEQGAAFLFWLATTPDCDSASCAVFRTVKDRYPALVAAYSRVDSAALREKLNQLVVAAPGIGGRRDLLQSNLVNANIEAQKTQLNAQIASMNETITTLHKDLRARDETIQALRSPPVPPASPVVEPVGDEQNGN